MSPTDTRTAILDLAEELLRSRSFNAFSYQDIAERIGIRKASIHYHFASKEDLGVALVERFRRRAANWASHLREQNVTTVQKLDAYFKIQGEVLKSDGLICALGILGAEFNTLPKRVKDSYVEFLEEQQVWLLGLLKKGQKEGTLVSDAEPEEKVALVQSSMMGALQLARASSSPERFHAVVKELRRGLLGQQEPSGTSTPGDRSPAREGARPTGSRASRKRR